MKTKIFINDMEIMNVKKIGKYIYMLYFCQFSSFLLVPLLKTELYLIA